jgi:hypothetical protein
MARDAVALTALSLNGVVDESAGVAIAPANGAAIQADGDTQRLLVVIKNTTAGARDVTVGAGAAPPSLRSGIGDLVVTLAQNDVAMMTLESARFAQGNGDIHLDFEAGMTGTVHAYRLPRGL